jgi:hypothetical protein
VSMQAENPRSVVGDNQAPAYAQRVTEQMERDYKALSDSITELLDKAREATKEAKTEAEALALGVIVKDLRDAYKRAEAYRTAEKEPHLRSAEAVDAFFFAWMEKCHRRNPRDSTQKPGAADILQARIDDFLERKRIEEANRRRQEEIEKARIAKEAQDEADRLAREAEEKRLAAERARKPESVAARTEEAEQVEAAAASAAVEAEVAQSQAVEAHIATLAKPADMVRTRGEGVLLTQAQEPYAIVVDRTKLDFTALAPYFNDKEIDKAFRGWAKSTNHAKQMPGAEIGHKAKGRTR